MVTNWFFIFNSNKEGKSTTLKTTSVSGRPDPPQAGRSFTASVQGNLGTQNFFHSSMLDHPVTSGKGKIEVWYSGFELFRDDNLDICKFGIIECPLKAGKINITYTNTIPDVAPLGGPYNVSFIPFPNLSQGTIELEDQDKRNVLCMKFKFEMDPPSVHLN